MEFVTSDGKVLSEHVIRKELLILICVFKNNASVMIPFWKKELLEWVLDKEIETKKYKDGNSHIKLGIDITENELKQLKQLKDYLEL